jgi:hypothetical protein
MITRVPAWLLAPVVASAGAAAPALAQETIKVAFCAWLTGFAAAHGASARHSAEIGVEEIKLRACRRRSTGRASRCRAVDSYGEDKMEIRVKNQQRAAGAGGSA